MWPVIQWWLHAPLKEAFWKRVDIRSNEECWPWTGGKSGADGRGIFCFHREADGLKIRLPASRASLFLKEGRLLRSEEFACHACDNPVCVNPAHLWVGSNQENVADARKKGRLFQQDMTHCKWGHPLVADNLVPSAGWRMCKTCHNARNRASKDKRAAARDPGMPKIMAQFSDEERRVICERRQYQNTKELAAVFGTNRQVISAICQAGNKGGLP